MRYSLLLVLALLLSLPASSRERSESEMQAIASSCLFGSLAKGSAAYQITPILKKDMLNVYGDNYNGFVIVSKDDIFRPVLGYSRTSFNADRMPDGLRWWIETAEKSMAAQKRSSFLATVNRAAVAPVSSFVTTTWGQEAPYNGKTPIISSSHAPTGCVATAMAQIMNFYKYPAQSNGMGYYYLGESQNPRTAFTNHQLDWANMLDSYESGTGTFITRAQRDAVATLMSDAGIASHMQYAAEGSGTTAWDAAYGLTHNFGYDSLAMKVDLRDFYTEKAWMEKIYTELQAKRPILYTGSDSVYGGHAFVFDGLDSEGRVHVNWGWNGEADGYYDISSLKPTSAILGEEDPTYEFSEIQAMITGFRTDSKPAADEKYQSQWSMYVADSMAVDNDTTMMLYAYGLYNSSFLTFKGYVGIAFEDVNGDEDKAGFLPLLFTNPPVTVDGAEQPFKALEGVSQPFMLPIHVSDLDYFKLPDGEYYAYLASYSIEEMQRNLPPNFVTFPDTGKGEPNFNVWRVKKSNGKFVSMTESDITSGISKITNKSANDGVTRYYDLQGRQLSNGSQKGIVIINKNGKSVKVLKK